LDSLGVAGQPGGLHDFDADAIEPGRLQVARKVGAELGIAAVGLNGPDEDAE
jgi:hypothetical protein